MHYPRLRLVRRNRIQAGLSYATVPVEAKEHSGTAHTYRFARDFQRLTFGVVNRNHPENGIIDLMRRDGRPIFILEDAASMEQLEDLLRPVLGGNFPPQEMSRFQGILREFEHMLTLFPECQIH